MTRLVLTSLLGTLLLPLIVHAQPRPPVEPTISARLDPVTLAPDASARLILDVTIPADHKAMSHDAVGWIATELTLPQLQGVSQSRVDWPTPKVLNDPILGPIRVFEGRFEIVVHLTTTAELPPGPIDLSGSLLMQICDSAGTCYAPFDFPFELAVDSTGTADLQAQASPSVAIPPTGPASLQQAPDDDFAGIVDGIDIQELLARPASDTVLGIRFTLDSLAGAMLAGFVAGLIFNVMPCVLPVLPLKAVGFFEAAGHDRAKTIRFGLFFTLGMITLFVAIGLGVVMSQRLFGISFSWGQQFSNPWVLYGIAAILGLLAVVLMGGYSFDLPASFYGLNFRHDTYSGNYLWGGFTAILSTPCTAPLFPVLIAWALGQPPYAALLAMASVGVGMGSPYLVLASFPQLARRFPRTGPAAELMKQTMGFLMLAAAAYFFGAAALGGDGNLWLVFAVAVWAGFYLVARSVQMFKSGSAILATTAISAAMIGSTLVVAMPSRNSVTWVDFSPAALTQARQEGRTVLLKFTASWCVNCQVIERTVFTDPTALEAINRRDIVAMKVDVDRKGWTFHERLAPQQGIPLTAIITPGSDRAVLLKSMYGTSDLIAALDAAKAASPIRRDAAVATR